MRTSTFPAVVPTWEPAVWVVAGAGVWFTVGWLPALVVVALLVIERVVRPGTHVLANSGVALLVLVPIAWFLGSSLPLFPPATRLNDNLLAHQLGGLAIWILFLAACVEVRPRESDAA